MRPVQTKEAAMSQANEQSRRAVLAMMTTLPVGAALAAAQTAPWR
jgi:hypothetical protein